MATYRPRGMPARFMQDAPAKVREEVIDIIRHDPGPLEFDVVFRHVYQPSGQMEGLDFGAFGERGCHFSLHWAEMRAYRERNRARRVAWKDLPEATQQAILMYLDPEAR